MDLDFAVLVFMKYILTVVTFLNFLKKLFAANGGIVW